VMVVRERDQGGVALHPTTLGAAAFGAVLGELARRRHEGSARAWQTSYWTRTGTSSRYPAPFPVYSR
jgi:hypothetical protein